MSNEKTGIHGTDMYQPYGVSSEYKQPRTKQERDELVLNTIQFVRETLKTNINSYSQHHRDMITAIHAL